VTAHRVELRPEARTVLLGLDTPIRRRIQRRIDALADNPWPADVAELAGQPGALWVQVGRHRLVYLAGDQRVLVLVIEADRRIAEAR
jgi:mRNA interferase RelE/StbE